VNGTLNNYFWALTNKIVTIKVTYYGIFDVLSFVGGIIPTMKVVLMILSGSFS
jgi:hypothetical protein